MSCEAPISIYHHVVFELLMTDNPSPVRQLIDSLRRYVTLNIDYARLTAAEKTSVLLAGVAFYAVMVILATLVLIFVSIGVGHLLAATIAPVWAFVFVAAFYVLLLVVVIIFRRQLFVNPIARFVSRIFVNPPRDKSSQQ